MSRASQPALSVVVPVFNEEGNAGPLCNEIRSVVRELTPDFEIIFVNDGSRDGTLDELRALCAEEPRLRVLDLDGNYGEAAALSAGFRAACGERVVTLDGDGQNDPHDIPRLLAALHERGVRVVSGWRRQRRESAFVRVLPSRIANFMIRTVTRLPMHDNGCGLKVYERAVLGGIQLPPGIHRFLPAVLGVGAAEVAEVGVNDRRRRHGESHYGPGRTVVVLRDLLAIRFMIARPRFYEPLFAALAAAALVAAAVGAARGAAIVSRTSVLVGVLAALVWWNLRRFNRAQRQGVCRVRREYTAAKSDEGAHRAAS